MGKHITGQKHIRCFFAIKLDQAATAWVVTLIEQLRQASNNQAIRFSAADDLHITLRFIAQLPVSDAPVLLKKVAQVVQNWPSFNLTIGPLQCFSDRGEPRCLILEIAASDSLYKLADAIEQVVVTHGLTLKMRPFRPHITLGRIKQAKFSMPTLTLQPRPDFWVKEVVFLHSELHSDKSVYSLLGKIALAKR